MLMLARKPEVIVDNNGEGAITEKVESTVYIHDFVSKLECGKLEQCC